MERIKQFYRLPGEGRNRTYSSSTFLIVLAIPPSSGLQAKNGIRGHCHHNSPPPPLPSQKLHDDRYRAFSVKYHGLVAHDILQGIVEHHPTQIFLQRVLSLLVGFEG